MQQVSGQGQGFSNPDFHALAGITLRPDPKCWRSLRSHLLAAGMILSGLLGSGPTLAETGRPQIQATGSARIEQRQVQQRQIQPENYDLQRFPVIDANERHWRNILWSTAIVNPEEAYVAEAFNNLLAMTSRPQLSGAQQRTITMALQVGTQLYLSHPELYGQIGQQFLQTIEHSTQPQWVAIALSGLAQGGMAAEQLQPLSDRIRQRFPRWFQDLHLMTTLRDLGELQSPPPLPPLKDLLNWAIAPEQLHLYVFCSRDRNQLCLSLLKDQQGQFVRLPGSPVATTGEIGQDQLWSVPLLLRSLHGLPWNFTRGQTPQGIYRIEGVIPQPDDEYFRAYGQFPLVNLFIPFEPGVREFLPGRQGTFTGPLHAYQNLLPPSWRNYRPLQQTYWAGQIGRSLFRIHGTGQAPDFFPKAESAALSYAWNPSIGCLSALEIYDQTGKLVQADMPKILNALTAAGGPNFSGYLVVVEVPAEIPLTPEAFEAMLRQQPGNG